MQSRIRVLGDNVINKIAAGEVIDRPASVVRELVDNSIDAGAKSIIVSIEAGGKNLIKISDDGHGMLRQDALLAFERHATSKINQAEDLETIATFGFRGEALAAISAVSQVKLATRSAECPIGTKVSISAGKIDSVEPCSMNVGTEIEIRNLFFNIPARKKFLRSDQSEEKHIRTWVLQSAIANFDVHYRILVNDREVLNLAPRSDLVARAREVVKGQLLPFDRRNGPFRVSGLVGHPSQARGTGQIDSLVIFVNRRLVKDKMVAKAVHEGFDSTLKSFEVPLGVISIEIPAIDVDINVHPQKSQVRFRAPQVVFLAVREAVKDAVQNFREPVRYADFRPLIKGGAEVREQFRFEMGQGSSGNLAVSSQAQLAFSDQDEQTAPLRYSELNYIGQVLECYLICELNKKMYVIDMHAAHERINFNRIRAGFDQKKLVSQRLLLPISVELGLEGLDNCLKHKEALERVGFEIEAFGESTLLIRSLPSILKNGRVEELLRELATIEFEGLGAGRWQERVDKISARIACHSSVRSGDRLGREEVMDLFRQMDSADFAAACPHGRPVIVSFEASEIEEWFGRDR